MSALWDMQPDETSRSYQAFSIYLNLVPSERSLRATNDALGRSSGNSVERWSAKYNWVERAAAYDGYMSSRLLVITESTLAEATEAHIRGTTMVYAKAEQLAMELLDDFEFRLHTKDKDGNTRAGTVEFKRILAAIEQIDTAKRRLLGLPTAYLHESTDKAPTEDQTYYVGRKSETAEDDEE